MGSLAGLSACGKRYWMAAAGTGLWSCDGEQGMKGSKGGSVLITQLKQA